MSSETKLEPSFAAGSLYGIVAVFGLGLTIYAMVVGAALGAVGILTVVAYLVVSFALHRFLMARVGANFPVHSEEPPPGEVLIRAGTPPEGNPRLAYRLNVLTAAQSFFILLVALASTPVLGGLGAAVGALAFALGASLLFAAERDRNQAEEGINMFAGPKVSDDEADYEMVEAARQGKVPIGWTTRFQVPQTDYHETMHGIKPITRWILKGEDGLLYFNYKNASNLNVAIAGMSGIGKTELKWKLMLQLHLATGAATLGFDRMNRVEVTYHRIAHAVVIRAGVDTKIDPLRREGRTVQKIADDVYDLMRWILERPVTEIQGNALRGPGNIVEQAFDENVTPLWDDLVHILRDRLDRLGTYKGDDAKNIRTLLSKMEILAPIMGEETFDPVKISMDWGITVLLLIGVLGKDRAEAVQYYYSQRAYNRFAKLGKRGFHFVLAYDEAHKYLNKAALSKAGEPVYESIFREGREPGVLSIVASQLPTDLPAALTGNTAMSFAFYHNTKEQKDAMLTLLAELSPGELRIFDRFGAKHKSGLRKDKFKTPGACFVNVSGDNRVVIVQAVAQQICKSCHRNNPFTEMVTGQPARVVERCLHCGGELELSRQYKAERALNDAIRKRHPELDDIGKPPTRQSVLKSKMESVTDALESETAILREKRRLGTATQKDVDRYERVRRQYDETKAKLADALNQPRAANALEAATTRVAEAQSKFSDAETRLRSLLAKAERGEAGGEAESQAQALHSEMGAALEEAKEAAKRAKPAAGTGAKEEAGAKPEDAPKEDAKDDDYQESLSMFSPDQAKILRVLRSEECMSKPELLAALNKNGPEFTETEFDQVRDGLMGFEDESGRKLNPLQMVRGPLIGGGNTWVYAAMPRKWRTRQGIIHRWIMRQLRQSPLQTEGYVEYSQSTAKGGDEPDSGLTLRKPKTALEVETGFKHLPKKEQDEEKKSMPAWGRNVPVRNAKWGYELTVVIVPSVEVEDDYAKVSGDNKLELTTMKSLPAHFPELDWSRYLKDKSKEAGE